MRDDELKSITDYPDGQREAATRVIVELANILSEYERDIMIIGGWVPELLFPNKGHVGSIDVDLLLNHLNLEEHTYNTIERILLRNGYRKHPEKYFTFTKYVTVDHVEYPVDVDILAGMYGGTTEEHRSQHIQGLRAVKATGGNFAFEVPALKVTVDAKRPDGARDSGTINVVSIVPYLMMKAAALRRGKAKDAYDIYFCIKNYPGGVEKLANEFRPFLGHGLVRKQLENLRSKFASIDHAGPADVVAFLEIYDEEEQEIIRRDVYEHVARFLETLS